jgi:hypothetical protein
MLVQDLATGLKLPVDQVRALVTLLATNPKVDSALRLRVNWERAFGQPLKDNEPHDREPGPPLPPLTEEQQLHQKLEYMKASKAAEVARALAALS